MALNWTCPHCNRPQTVTDSRHYTNTTAIGVGDIAEGSLAFERTVIGCSNPECKKVTVWIRIGQDVGYQNSWVVKAGTELFCEQIMPRGQAKPQPDFIPEALREDYYEACLICSLSPKASATLARRCLQGMIRDFAGISKRRLVDEIEALATAVEVGTADRAITPETVAAIDHVRSVGNIAAHMEADVDVIVPVDPGEAKAMIELIEMLFDEWYGAQHRRQQKLQRIADIRADKDEIKRGTKAKPQAGSSDEVAASGASALLDD